jgi:hypothetical protein
MLRFVRTSPFSRTRLEIGRGLVVPADAWLPKHPVRRGANFHSVGVFDRIERLHREVSLGGMDLVLTSGDLSGPTAGAPRATGRQSSSD